MTKQKYFLIFSLFILGIMIFASPALAQTSGNGDLFNIWRGTGGNTDVTTCNQPGYNCTLCDGIIVASNVIALLLLLGAALAAVIILYGAVRFMTSGGSQNQVGEAKSILWKALIGFALMMIAWLIVNTIFSVFTNRANWNEVNPIGCPSGKLSDANGGIPEKNPSQEGKPSNFKGPDATPEEISAMQTQTEGTNVAPVTSCDHSSEVPNLFSQTLSQNPELERYTNAIGNNLASYFPNANFLNIKIADASGFGSNVIRYAKQYMGDLKYSNETTARRDPTGKSPECQNLIQGTNYNGCGDCSGFAFKMYACAAGEDIGQHLDNSIAVNSAILSSASLPSGLERYYTHDMSYDQIKQVLGPGDVMGYDVTCNKRENGSSMSMGHVMIFESISGDYWKMIDQGSSGGAREHDMSPDKWKAFYNCGYIIHIKG